MSDVACEEATEKAGTERLSGQQLMVQGKEAKQAGGDKADSGMDEESTQNTPESDSDEEMVVRKKSTKKSKMIIDDDDDDEDSGDEDSIKKPTKAGIIESEDEAGNDSADPTMAASDG